MGPLTTTKLVRDGVLVVPAWFTPDAWAAKVCLLMGFSLTEEIYFLLPFYSLGGDELRNMAMGAYPRENWVPNSWIPTCRSSSLSSLSHTNYKGDSRFQATRSSEKPIDFVQIVRMQFTDLFRWNKGKRKKTFTDTYFMLLKNNWIWHINTFSLLNSLHFFPTRGGRKFS